MIGHVRKLHVKLLNKQNLVSYRFDGRFASCPSVSCYGGVGLHTKLHTVTSHSVPRKTSFSSFISSLRAEDRPEDSIDVGGEDRSMGTGRDERAGKSREDLEREGHKEASGRPTCSGCGHPIVWMITPQGRTTPFEIVEGVPDYEPTRFRLHWPSCPQAIEFRTLRFGKTPGKKRQK